MNEEETIIIENNLSPFEYNNLRKSIGWDVKEKDIAENAIKNSVIVKKAVYRGMTVGMARVIGDGIYYLIVDVIVDPAYQRKGIGRKIINEIEEDIRNKTKNGQKCSINLISINGKEEFYEKCGFRKVPFDYTGFGMIKKIKNESDFLEKNKISN